LLDGFLAGLKSEMKSVVGIGRRRRGFHAGFESIRFGGLSGSAQIGNVFREALLGSFISMRRVVEPLIQTRLGRRFVAGCSAKIAECTRPVRFFFKHVSK